MIEKYFHESERKACLNWQGLEQTATVRIFFSEFQGYYERVFYRRYLKEISIYYEQAGSRQAFIAVVLFVDEKYDPDNCPITDFGSGVIQTV
jgi:hypothetical protein